MYTELMGKNHPSSSSYSQGSASGHFSLSRLLGPSSERRVGKARAVGSRKELTGKHMPMRAP